MFVRSLELTIYQVKKIIAVRRLATAASRVFDEETPDALADFSHLFESQPEIMLPYLHELIEIAKLKRLGVTALLKGDGGKEILALYNAAVNTPSPLAEAYFLDPAAADWQEGLLLSAVSDATNRVKMEGIFGAVAPLDELGMILLLAMGEAGDFRTSILKPDMVFDLNKLKVEYFLSRQKLARLDESAVDVKPVIPVIFTYWLAWEKDRLQNLPEAEEGSSAGPGGAEAILKNLGEIPSKTLAIENVRELIRSGKFSWDYYGKDVALKAAKAFEASAR